MEWKSINFMKKLIQIKADIIFLSKCKQMDIIPKGLKIIHYVPNPEKAFIVSQILKPEEPIMNMYSDFLYNTDHRTPPSNFFNKAPKLVIYLWVVYTTEWSTGVDWRALCSRFSGSSLDLLNRPSLYRSQQCRSLLSATSGHSAESKTKIIWLSEQKSMSTVKKRDKHTKQMAGGLLIPVSRAVYILK
ncbi:hypothetical protein UY3_08400 [Chelonia mydas]|uniref:Uncharacterized protein n=1 Tax=Chelonia mydas TaxID=8469 RepID=M7BQU1_CHEMY|nr:hypothetical protein UY3_08400 [Chelonia mydas]